jgi:hypothetical protein
MWPAISPTSRLLVHVSLLDKSQPMRQGSARPNNQLQLSAPTWQVGAPTVIPFIVMVNSFAFTFGAGDKEAAVLLAGSCAVLFGSAAWLNRALFGRFGTFAPFATAVIVVLLVWIWQRQAFAALVPPGGLPYGYFLTAQGANARFWVLTAPYFVGIASLVLCCLVALVCWWRAGARLSLLCMCPWWLALFVVFALPSVYLGWQGDASLFI